MRRSFCFQIPGSGAGGACQWPLTASRARGARRRQPTSDAGIGCRASPQLSIPAQGRFHADDYKFRYLRAALPVPGSRMFPESPNNQWEVGWGSSKRPTCETTARCPGRPGRISPGQTPSLVPLMAYRPVTIWAPLRPQGALPKFPSAALPRRRPAPGRGRQTNQEGHRTSVVLLPRNPDPPVPGRAGPTTEDA